MGWEDTKGFRVGRMTIDDYSNRVQGIDILGFRGQTPGCPRPISYEIKYTHPIQLITVNYGRGGSGVANEDD